MMTKSGKPVCIDGLIMVFMVGSIMVGSIVPSAQAGPQPGPGAYGHAFWNPPLKSGSYDDLAEFMARFFPNETVAVTAHDGKPSIDIEPLGTSSFRVTVRTLGGENESFDQHYQIRETNAGAAQLGIPVDQLRPTIDVPHAPVDVGGGRGVVLMGPPGSMPLNGSTDLQKARVFAAMAGFDHPRFYPVNESPPGTGFGRFSIYNSFWQCPSANANFCGSFRSIDFDCSGCSHVAIGLGNDNSSGWYEARFNQSVLYEARGQAGAWLYFYHGDLVAAVLNSGYQLNVSNMLSPGAAEDRVISYLQFRGYGVDRPDLERGPADVYLAPLGSRSFNVTATLYSCRTYLYSLALAQQMFGNGTVPPLNVAGAPYAVLNSTTVGRLYLRTNLSAWIFQDTITGDVVNITYHHWYRPGVVGVGGGSPGNFHVAAPGVSGLVAAVAVALALVRRRRAG